MDVKRSNLARLRECRGQEVRAVLPKPLKGRKKERTQPPLPAVPSVHPVPPPPPPNRRWWRYIDTSSGYYYFYEEFSGVTTWNEPPFEWLDAGGVAFLDVRSPVRAILSSQLSALTDDSSYRTESPRGPSMDILPPVRDAVNADEEKDSQSSLPGVPGSDPDHLTETVVPSQERRSRPLQRSASDVETFTLTIPDDVVPPSPSNQTENVATAYYLSRQCVDFGYVSPPATASVDMRGEIEAIQALKQEIDKLQDVRPALHVVAVSGDALKGFQSIPSMPPPVATAFPVLPPRPLQPSNLLKYTLTLFDAPAPVVEPEDTQRVFWPPSAGSVSQPLAYKRVVLGHASRLLNKRASAIQLWWRCVRFLRRIPSRVYPVAVSFMMHTVRTLGFTQRRPAFGRCALLIQSVWRLRRRLRLKAVMVGLSQEVPRSRAVSDAESRVTAGTSDGEDPEEAKRSKARRAGLSAGRHLAKVAQEENARKLAAKRLADEKRRLALELASLRQKSAQKILMCFRRFYFRRMLREVAQMYREECLELQRRRFVAGLRIRAFVLVKYAKWRMKVVRMKKLVALKMQCLFRGRLVRKNVETMNQAALRRAYSNPNRQNLEQVFAFIDSHHRGVVSVSEFTTAIRRAAIAAAELTKSPFLQMQLFSRIDKEIKGNVDLDAFVRALEGSTDVLFVEWMEKLLLKLHFMSLSPKSSAVKGSQSARVVYDTKRQASQFFKMADNEKTGRLFLPNFQTMLRKGPPSLDLSDDFDQQTALFERIVKKAGGEPLTLASFVDAVVAMEHLEFNAWLSHVFPIRCAPAAPPAVQADAVANPFTSIALARVAATRIRK